MRIQLEAHHEQQQGYAHMGQQFDLIVAGDPPQSEGADGDPGRQQGNDQGLLQKQAQSPHGRGQEENGGNLIKQVDEGPDG